MLPEHMGTSGSLFHWQMGAAELAQHLVFLMQDLLELNLLFTSAPPPKPGNIEHSPGLQELIHQVPWPITAPLKQVFLLLPLVCFAFVADKPL